MKNYKEDYLGILDGVRGLMAFWVFFYHLELATIGKSPPWGEGAIAVDIFMLLSGFLMAYHWHLRKERFKNLRHQAYDFYIRRLFRIAPLYYILVTVALFGQDFFFEAKAYVESIVPPPWVTDNVGFVVPEISTISFANIAAHYSFLFGLFPQFADSNILPDWSISLEMQFYLVFPLLMISFSRFGSFSNVAVFFLLALVTNHVLGLYHAKGMLGNYPQPSMLLFKINLFVSGICFAYAYFYRDKLQAIPWLVLGFISIAISPIQVKIFAVFIIFMLYFDKEKNELFHKLSANRILKFFGDTSYAVYLLHLMILLPVLYGLFHYDWFVSLSPVVRLGVSLLLVGIPVYGISYLLFRLIELPGISLSRRILKKRN